jgi:hypothetical protein
MIEEYYASKRVVAKPIQVPYNNKHYALTHNVGASSPFETTRAEKMGLTVEVYRHRVTEVSRAQSECSFQVGDTCWPADEKDIEQYGMCQVVGVCRHYNDYGTVDWHEPPYILSIQSLRDRTEMLNTTANWVVRHRPVFLSPEEMEC